ncbi:MAG TPA: hypothetical protein VIE39_09185 [Thermoanaerobaculia bacterium]
MEDLLQLGRLSATSRSKRAGPERAIPTELLEKRPFLSRMPEEPILPEPRVLLLAAQAGETTGEAVATDPPLPFQQVGVEGLFGAPVGGVVGDPSSAALREVAHLLLQPGGHGVARGRFGGRSRRLHGVLLGTP